MVKIPEIYRQTPTPAQGGGVTIDINAVPGLRATAAVAGAQVGQALSQLGQTGQQLAQEEFAKVQAYEDAEFKTKFKARVRGKYLELSDKAQQVKGHQTKGISQVYAQELEDVISASKEDAPSDAAKLWADDWGESQKYSFSDSLLRYERDERERASLETFQSLVNDSIRTTYYDPATAKANIMEVKADLLDLANGGVISMEKAKAVFQEAKDKINLAQAQAMLDRDPRGFKKAIDRGEYNHLDENNLRSLRKAAKTEIRSLDAEARQAKSEERAIAKDQLYNLNSYMKDEEASVLSTGKRLRDVDVAGMVRYGEDKGLFRPGTAKDYENRMRALEETHWIIAETKTEPLQERLDLAQNRLAPKPGEPGYAEKQQRFAMAQREIVDDWKQYLTDPVVYLQPEVEKRAIKAIENGLLDPNDETANIRARIEIGIALQEQMGGDAIRVLSAGQSEQLNSQFMGATPDEKIALAQQWEGIFGDRFGRVMAESKLDTGYIVAAQLATDPANRPLARVLMQVSGRKESEFEVAEKSEIKKQVVDSFNGSEYGEVLSGLMATFPDDAAMTTYANGMRTLIYKASMHYVETGMSYQDAVKHVVQQFDNMYGTISNDDLGFVLFSKKSSPGDIENGLEAAREHIAKQYNPDMADIIREGAIWMNDGDDFVLVYSDTADQVVYGHELGGYVTDKDGIPIRITADGAESLGRGTESFNDIHSQIKNQLAPWRKIAREKMKPEASLRPQITKLGSLIDRAAVKYDLPRALIEAVLETESGGNPYAQSDQGARGLMQLMPETGARYGLSGPADFYNPERNLMAGARYLADLWKRYDGNVDKVIAAYHQGEATVDKGLDAIGPKGQNYLNVVGERYRQLRGGG